jgi:hypothetical protein
LVCLYKKPFPPTGADVVDWLDTHVEGFVDRRDARKYASQMLKAGYIRHTVNKITFSEQCYYIFGELLTSGSEYTALEGFFCFSSHSLYLVLYCFAQSFINHVMI